MTPDIRHMKAVAEAATKGKWHHAQPFQTANACRTIYGPVPACRVDYVSTWPELGTPQGHRVIIPMEGRECGVSSENMAHIAAWSPAPALAVLAFTEAETARADRAEAALVAAEQRVKELKVTLRTIAEWPVSHPRENLDAVNMQTVVAAALLAEAQKDGES